MTRKQINNICYSLPRVNISLFQFKINIEEEKPNTDEIEAERKFPSDDCFHLVAIKRWEDDIIWSPEDVKLNPLSEGIAGWIPSANIRTTLAYANQHTTGLLF
jgi:hypothetical protein